MTWAGALGVVGARPLRPAQEDWLDTVWAGRRVSTAWGPLGAVGLLGCGHGKTLCAWLAPALWASRRPLLLAPAALLPQIERELLDWGRDYPALLEVRRRATLVSYERLSTPSSSPIARDLLSTLAPDAIVCDEAHLLGNPESARWKRITRYLVDRPGTRFAALSGTLSWSSVRQLAHLLHAALRSASPLPAWAVDAVATVVDVGGEPSAADWATVGELLGQAVRPRTKEAARAALHARLLAAPGVVHASGVAADVSLELEVVDRPADYPGAFAAALDRLRDRWELPDGAELVDAIEVHAARRSLVWGWWARWREDARRDPAWAPWFAARAAWAGAAQRAQYAGAESPGVAAELARRGRLPGGDNDAWRTWEDLRDHGPAREVVWLPGARAWTGDHLARFARTRNPGPYGEELVWYASRAVEDALRAERIDTRGAGSPAPSGGAWTAASWLVHGKGWNGQGYPRATIAELPDSAGAWEQLLARAHRPGQIRDVRVRVLAYDESAHAALRGAFAGARYAETVLGQPQRLTLATWTHGRPVG